MRVPEHVDIIPITLKIEQNLILSDLKKLIELESIRQSYAQFDKTTFQTLNNKLHLITFNTGKALYYLYLVKRNNRQCAFLIDKRLTHIWLIKSSFAPEFYKQTLLEVNLLEVEKPVPNIQNMMLEEQLYLHNNSSQNLLVLVHDILLLNGKNIYNKNLEYRYNQIVNLFKTSSYQYQIYDFIEYNFKPYFQYHHLESVWFDLRPELNYMSQIQGILFRPVDKNATDYYYNVNPNIKRPNKYIEIKDRNQPLNLLLRKTDSPDNYRLFALDRDRQLKYIDIALINDLTTRKMLQQILHNKYETIFICKYDENFKKWKPIELSQTDKPDIIYGFTEKLIYTD